jgi:hypothetical protein
MGWGSGGQVFDTVADALIDAQAQVPFSDELFGLVLGPLFRSLRDADWDTVDESVERFRDFPLVLQVISDGDWGVPADDPADPADDPDRGEWGL